MIIANTSRYLLMFFALLTPLLTGARLFARPVQQTG
jgi:hypothetical protein